MSKVRSLGSGPGPVRIDRWQIADRSDAGIINVYFRSADGIAMYSAFLEDGCELEAESLADLKGKVVSHFDFPGLHEDVNPAQLNRLAELTGWEDAMTMGTASYAAAVLDFILREDQGTTISEVRSSLERQTDRPLRYGGVTWQDKDGSGEFLIFRDETALAFFDGEMLPLPVSLQAPLHSESAPGTKIKIRKEPSSNGDTLSIAFLGKNKGTEIALPAGIDEFPEGLMHALSVAADEMRQAHSFMQKMPPMRRPLGDSIDAGTLTIAQDEGIWIDHSNGEYFYWPPCLGHRRCRLDVYEPVRPLVEDLMEMMLWADPNLSELSQISLCGANADRHSGDVVEGDLLHVNRYSQLRSSDASFRLNDVMQQKVSILGEPVAFETYWDGHRGHTKNIPLMTVQVKRPDALRACELEDIHGKLFSGCSGYKDPSNEVQALRDEEKDVDSRVITMPMGGHLSRPGRGFKLEDHSFNAFWSGGLRATQVAASVAKMKQSPKDAFTPLERFWGEAGIYRDSFHGSLVLFGVDDPEMCSAIGYVSLGGTVNPKAVEDGAHLHLHLSIDGAFIDVDHRGEGTETGLIVAVFDAIISEFRSVSKFHRRRNVELCLSMGLIGADDSPLARRIADGIQSKMDDFVVSLDLRRKSSAGEPSTPGPLRFAPPTRSDIWDNPFRYQALSPDVSCAIHTTNSTSKALASKNYLDLFTCPIVFPGRRSEGDNSDLIDDLLERVRDGLSKLGVTDDMLVLRDLPLVDPKGRENGALTWLPRQQISFNEMIERQLPAYSEELYPRALHNPLKDGHGRTLQLLDGVHTGDEVLAVWILAALVPILVSGRMRKEGVSIKQRGLRYGERERFLTEPPANRYAVGYSADECQELACQAIGWQVRTFHTVWSQFSTDALPVDDEVTSRHRTDNYRDVNGDVEMLDYIVGSIAASALTHVPVRASSCLSAPLPWVADRLEALRKERDERYNAAQLSVQQEKAKKVDDWLNPLERRYRDLPISVQEMFAPGEGSNLSRQELLAASGVLSLDALSVFLGVSLSKAGKDLDKAIIAEMRAQGVRTLPLPKSHALSYGRASLSEYSYREFLVMRTRRGAAPTAAAFGVSYAALAKYVQEARRVVFKDMPLPLALAGKIDRDAL